MESISIEGFSSTTAAAIPEDAIALRASANGRTNGKHWKAQRSATRRTQMAPSLRTKSWETRLAQRTQEDAIKKLAKELKDEKQAEVDRKRQVVKERRDKKEEKARLEAMAAKLSAKKMARLKKRAGRSKKVRG